MIGFVGAQGVRAFYGRLPSPSSRSAATRVVAHRPQLVSESSEPMAAVPLSPSIQQGRTALAGGQLAIRAGDGVTVEFDTPLARTRRADKFEVTVRATLPQIFGAVADTLLSTIPAGRLISDRELLTESPLRGLRLDGGTRGAIAIWPVTRRGQGGPLVIAYRAIATR
ncbi:MAG: hypothetical protein M3068_06245 [Gemmatimonadota bacterium]|nr:hypothetical protein [Gemmatimonadota bacterium]